MPAEGANRSKGNREFQNKEQTARKRLENFSRRSKPLERDQRKFQQKEQTARKELENCRTRSKPLERD